MNRSESVYKQHKKFFHPEKVKYDNQKPLSNVNLKNLGFPTFASKNQIKSKLTKLHQNNKNYYLLINLDTTSSGRMGTHWVCIVYFNEISLYFDPFGYGPPKVIKQFYSEKKNINKLANDQKMQVYRNNNCGWWCSWVVYKLLKLSKDSKDKNDTINNLIDFFNKKYNEQKLKEWINKVQKTSY